MKRFAGLFTTTPNAGGFQHFPDAMVVLVPGLFFPLTNYFGRLKHVHFHQLRLMMLVENYCAATAFVSGFANLALSSGTFS